MQIIFMITLLLVGIGVFELRAIRKNLTAHDTEMPHWFHQWLKDEEDKLFANRKREYEATRSISRYSAGSSSEAGKTP